MKTHALLSILVTLVLFAGCSQRPTAIPGRKSSEGHLITAFGEYSVIGGAFTVSVSQPDGKLEITRGQHFDVLTATNPSIGEIVVARNAVVTNTYSSAGWKAQPGWFVFAQDASRVWAYDGNKFLWLLAIFAPAGDSGSYGPRSFPFPVPEQVLERLPESVKSKIEIHAR